MIDKIKMWEIDDSSKSATLVEPTDRVETERSLEEVFVRNPNVLMSDLALVGRQTPTDSGILDLLGVDRDGRLVVFELKREKVTREAVAQVIDYCSYLDSLTETELADYIADHSGEHGVDKIDDFASWYRERQGKPLIDLRPTRMALVGLGTDAQADRMVDFLTERGVDISLSTFHGYRYGDKTLLARQIERDLDAPRGDADGRRKLAERARELDIRDLWQDAVKALSIASNGSVTRKGLTFYLPKIRLPHNVSVSGSHSVVIHDSKPEIRVTFYPAAVDICLEQFQLHRETIPFQLEKPPNAPTTKRVPEQWYCWLNQTTWGKHKAELTKLAENVHDAWQEVRRSGTEASRGS